MNKYRGIWNIVIGGIFLCGMFSSAQAQDADYTSWMKLGANYEFGEKLDFSGGLEWRTKNHLRNTDRWGVDLGAKYAILPFLKLGAGYEIHYRNRGDEGWKFRHRYHADGTLSARWARLKFSLRERFQHTWDDVEDEWRMRSRLKMAYDWPQCRVEPYVSVEMYNSLNRGDRFEVARMRYRAGTSFPLFSDKWEADLFYCRQWEADGRKNIFGLDCVYKF